MGSETKCAGCERIGRTCPACIAERIKPATPTPTTDGNQTTRDELAPRIRESATLVDGHPMVLAEDPSLPGLIGYGADSDEAVAMLHTLRDVMAERLLPPSAPTPPCQRTGSGGGPWCVTATTRWWSCSRTKQRRTLGRRDG